jgi:hypothetical protein
VLWRICNTYTVLVCLAGQDVKYFSAEFNNETFFTEPSSAAPPTVSPPLLPETEAKVHLDIR